MAEEKDAFDKAMPIFMILGVICGLMAIGIYFFGLPNFDNVEGQMSFCVEAGGVPIEPNRENHNTALCGFQSNEGFVEYYAQEISEDYADVCINKTEGDFYFICWDSKACRSTYIANLSKRGFTCMTGYEHRSEVYVNGEKVNESSESI